MLTITRGPHNTHAVAGGTLPPPVVARKKPVLVTVREMNDPFEVETLEGVMAGKAGDFLITGVSGEMRPCRRDIFFQTYELMVD